MTTLQIQRYIANDDISTLAYKQFNKSPKDKYPTFTFCFESSNGEIFDGRYLTTTIGISGREYQDTLLGLKKSDDNQLKSVLGENYQEVAINIKSVMTTFVRLTSPTTKNKKSLPKKITDNLYISYQDANRICFTRQNKFENRIYPVYEFIALNLASWESKQGLYFEVYVHHPGQFMRVLYLSKGLFYYPIPYLLDKDNNQILITLSLTNVLRRRPDARDACDPLLHDDETKFRQMVMDMAKCVPPYWKPLHINYSAFPDCISQNQIAAIHNATSKPQDTIALYDPPCDEMNVVTNVILTPHGNIDGKRNSILNAMFSKGKLFLRIHYLDRTYQEVTNNRDFGFGSFWASVGGLIGIFLGYSMLQMPELVLALLCRND